MKKKKIIFILGSGRCGTYSFHKAFEKIKNIESHHEFFFEPTLRLATLYRMKKISKDRVKSFIYENHYNSFKNSKHEIWVNSCNALPWISNILVEIFPNAKYVHLVRSGRKVVSSFYNKFNDLMYKKENLIILDKFLNKKIRTISSEKKYWRPTPIDKQEYSHFIKKGQFYRNCWYWSEINKKIENSIAKSKNNILFKFENIHKKKKLDELISFFEISKSNQKIFYNSFKSPANVAIPKNFYFNKLQNKTFIKECGNDMKKYGYNVDEDYEIIY